MIVSETTIDASGGAIETQRAATDDERAQLVHEAAMLALARHPGVVEIIRTGPEGAELVTACPTGSLAALADRPDAWLEALAGVCETMADLHALGIVHGDLTAENIRMSGTGRPVLTGFGHAGLAGEDRHGRRLRPTTDVEALARLAGQATPPAPGPLAARRTGPSELARLLEAGEQGHWPPARRLARAIEAERPAGASDPFARLRPPAEAEARPRPARPPLLAALAGLIGAAAVTWGGLHLAWPDAATHHAPAAPASAGLPRSAVERPTPSTASTGPATETGLVAPGGVVAIGGDHYEIAERGDLVLVADWGCRGQTRAVVARVRTGELFAFAAWATTGHPLTASPAGQVAAGSHVTITHDARGCATVAATAPDGRVQVMQPQVAS